MSDRISKLPESVVGHFSFDIDQVVTDTMLEQNLDVYVDIDGLIHIEPWAIDQDTLRLHKPDEEQMAQLCEVLFPEFNIDLKSKNLVWPSNYRDTPSIQQLYKEHLWLDAFEYYTQNILTFSQLESLYNEALHTGLPFLNLIEVQYKNKLALVTKSSAELSEIYEDGIPLNIAFDLREMILNQDPRLKPNLSLEELYTNISEHAFKIIKDEMLFDTDQFELIAFYHAMMENINAPYCEVEQSILDKEQAIEELYDLPFGNADPDLELARVCAKAYISVRSFLESVNEDLFKIDGQRDPYDILRTIMDSKLLTPVRTYIELSYQRSVLASEVMVILNNQNFDDLLDEFSNFEKVLKMVFPGFNGGDKPLNPVGDL